MKELSRRKMLGSAAASVAVGIGLVKSGALAETAIAAATSTRAGGGTRPPLRTMTLDEFNALEQPEVDRVLSMLDCQTFSCCHEKVREETGIWIPELVPVFGKLDALRSSAGA
jgi:hypothetical protein